MSPIALLLLAHVSAAHTFPFEIHSNKPFVQVTVDGSGPLWFILDTGNNGPSIIARECADRLQLKRGAEAKVQIGAGSGADVGLSEANAAVHLRALGETLTVAQPRILTLGHVSRVEGRRVDGLLGHDFLSRHVVEIDYARRTMTIHDPASYVPPTGAAVVPLDLDTGWPLVEGTITPRGGAPVPCRLIVDTGVRFTLALFRPFSEQHALHDSPGSLHDLVVGAGAGGLSRGDVARLDSLSLGPISFAHPVAYFSRDTIGVFAFDGPDGIIGGELLLRHRVTFDCPHARMILEPYATGPTAFEYDMSGLFLGTEGVDFTKIRILAVNPGTPAAEAGLQTGDEIVSIDGRRTPNLSVDDARALLRRAETRRLQIRREGQLIQVRLAAHRMV